MSKTIEYSVSGTTCRSCEVLIERELGKLPGVERVRVSHETGIARLTVEGAAPSVADLEAAVGHHGYRFSTAAAAKRGVDFARIAKAAAAVLVAYWILDRVGFLRFSPTVGDAGGLWTAFAVGLVAAVSSCTAVVSGLLVAVSANAAKHHAHDALGDRLRPHALFNAGRLAGFVAFGALIGLIGKAVTLSAGASGIFVIAIAATMILLGVSLLDLFPGRRIFPRLPKSLAHRVHALQDSRHPLIPFVLGAATFFLPCGFTQAMQLYALSTGDPLRAAATMGVFALGTMPALLGIGFVSSAAKGNWLNRLSRGAGVFVIVLGISNLLNGAALLGWNADSSFAGAQDDTGTAATVTDGEQVVQMEVTNYGTYEPDVLRVKRGIPVRWQVYGGNSMGCADTLVMGAFGIERTLAAGLNEIVFTPTKAGRFAFSCAMGMVRGTMIVE